MANIKFIDANNNAKYRKSSGSGSDGDPVASIMLDDLEALRAEKDNKVNYTLSRLGRRALW